MGIKLQPYDLLKEGAYATFSELEYFFEAGYKNLGSTKIDEIKVAKLYKQYDDGVEVLLCLSYDKDLQLFKFEKVFKINSIGKTTSYKTIDDTVTNPNDLTKKE